MYVFIIVLCNNMRKISKDSFLCYVSNTSKNILVIIAKSPSQMTQDFCIVCICIYTCIQKIKPMTDYGARILSSVNKFLFNILFSDFPIYIYIYIVHNIRYDLLILHSIIHRHNYKQKKKKKKRYMHIACLKFY